MITGALDSYGSVFLWIWCVYSDSIDMWEIAVKHCVSSFHMHGEKSGKDEKAWSTTAPSWAIFSFVLKREYLNFKKYIYCVLLWLIFLNALCPRSFQGVLYCELCKKKAQRWFTVEVEFCCCSSQHKVFCGTFRTALCFIISGICTSSVTCTRNVITTLKPPIPCSSTQSFWR